MKIRSASLTNFRNHIHTEVDFSPSVNIFYGRNGAGKTSILEAISVCGFSKSFLAVPDTALIKQGEEYFYSTVNALSDHEVPYKVNVAYTEGARKKISSSHGENLIPKDIIGELPLVVLSPDNKNITFGSPADRRQFMDSVLSQSSKRYVEDAINLRKILKQRNNLLNQAKISSGFNKGFIDSWTEAFIRTAAEIVVRRKNFLEEFSPYFQAAYEEVSGNAEAVSLVYQPDAIPEDFPKENFTQEKILGHFDKTAQNLWREELRRGATVFGPQKDEIKISINGGLAKEFASQGQHKSLLIALKFAEFEFLREKKSETPVVLLDDIFSELDNFRSEKVFSNVIVTTAQTCITTTDALRLLEIIPGDLQIAVYRVERGEIHRER